MNKLDALEQYKEARKLGRRYVSEHSGRPEAELPVLREKLGFDTTELPLGCAEIPLKKIRGTVLAGRRPAFAGNFMPLMDATSEFAAKWTNLMCAQDNEGIRDPVEAVEYLGYYYILEGHKRVSVLRKVGAYSVAANIGRILPEPGDMSVDAQVLRELVSDEPRRIIRHMWFSAPGAFTELRGLYDSADGERDSLESLFGDFRREYHECGYGTLPVTTGDAFLIYSRAFGFDGLTREKLKACERLFRGKEAVFTPLRQKSARVIFAFGTDEAWTAPHRAAAAFLRRMKPELEMTELYGPPDDSVEAEVLISTHPEFAAAARRSYLLERGLNVLQYGAALDGIAGYALKTGEPVFLAGAIAASRSNSGLVAFIHNEGSLFYSAADASAFAAGARLVSERCRVLSVSAGEQELQTALRLAAENGADTVLLPYGGGVLEPRLPVGAYAAVGALGQGRIGAYWGALMCRWDRFYLSILNGDNGFSYAQTGISSGVLSLQLMSWSLGIHQTALAALLKNAVLMNTDILSLEEYEERDRIICLSLP